MRELVDVYVSALAGGAEEETTDEELYDDVGVSGESAPQVSSGHAGESPVGESEAGQVAGEALVGGAVPRRMGRPVPLERIVEVGEGTEI